MIGSGPQNGFRVQQRSILTIRLVCENVCRVLGINDITTINIASFLDTLSVERGITYAILEQSEMPSGVEAYCIPEQFLFCIRSDVYERACSGYPRDKFTIFHELGHLLLGHRRTINRETNETELKTSEDSEWQANQFAAEILMPLSEIKKHNLKNEFDIQFHFNVSFQAASNRFRQLSRRGEI